MHGRICRTRVLQSDKNRPHVQVIVTTVGFRRTAARELHPDEGTKPCVFHVLVRGTTSNSYDERGWRATFYTIGIFCCDRWGSCYCSWLLRWLIEYGPDAWTWLTTSEDLGARLRRECESVVAKRCETGSR